MPETAPLQPTTQPSNSAQTPTANGAKQTTREALSTTKPASSSLPYKKATLVKQQRDPRYGPEYKPLEIRFLTGALADQVLDIGFNVKEMSTSQTSEWEKGKNQSVRVGHNFTSVSPRTFSFTLEYWSLNEDVQQLCENNAFLHTISDKTITPPKVQFSFGSATIDPLVCTNLEIKYDSPLPNGNGMRHGTVQLTFELEGGQGTKHALAPPLAPTGLQNYIERTTQLDRDRRGQVGRVRSELAPCLGKDGSDKVAKLIEENKLNDIGAIAALPSDTFIQLAVAGSLSKDVLAKPEIQDKLKRDLAAEMARREDGVTPNDIRSLANSLLNGSPSGLSNKLTQVQNVGRENADGTQTVEAKSTFDLVNEDYSQILQAISTQDLGTNGAIFDRQKNPNATQTMQRLTGVAKCGLGLRQAGAPQVANVEGSEAVLLAGINNAIQGAKSDEEIKQMFGLPANTPETVIRKIRGSVPYRSKAQFLNDASYNQQGITGLALWSNFDGHESATMTQVNAFITNKETTADQIKQRFGVDDVTAAKLRNNSQPFKDKTEFLHSISPDQGLDGKGNEYWRNFQQNSAQEPAKGETKL